MKNWDFFIVLRAYKGVKIMDRKRLALAISATLSIAGVTGCSTISGIKASPASNDDEKVVVYHVSYQKERQLDGEINALAKKLGLGKFSTENLPEQVQKKIYRHPLIRHARYDHTNNAKVQFQKVVLDKQRVTPHKITAVKPTVTRKITKQSTEVEAVNLSAFEREVNRLYAAEKVSVSPQQISRNSIWSRITRGYCLDANIEKPLVQKILNQYARNPQHLNRLFERSGKYLHFIVNELKRRKMPTELALLPMVESAYDNALKSRSGGVGLWQFTSTKGKLLGLKQTNNYDARMDVFSSTRVALDALQRLNKKFAGDWNLTLASFKVGEKRVQHEIMKNRRDGQPTDYWHLALPREAKEYIPQLLAYREILLRPYAYGLDLPVVKNTPQITQIVVDKPIDLHKVARAAKLPASTLTALNLNFKNAITDPSYSRKVVLPRQYASQLHQAISLAPGVITASYKAKNQSKRYIIAKKSHSNAQVINYRVRAGENLYKIALRHGTTVTKIMRLNGMQNTKIKAGANLKIALKSSLVRRT